MTPRAARPHVLFVRRLLPAVCACVLLTPALVATEPETIPVLRRWTLADPGQRIVNGVNTTGFPSVVALLSNRREYCTGTFIGCETVLTAAHCVCNSTGANCQNHLPNPDFVFAPGQIELFAQHAGFFAVASIHVAPDFEFAVTSDVAILKLAGGPIDGVAPSAINTTAKPAPGTSGRLVGFGITQGGADDTGVKRTGLVTTVACTGVPDATHLCWDFTSPLGAPGEDSNTCSGDSGGPLFVDLGGGGVVAGVTSGGANAACLPTDRSFDADVFANRTFLQSQGGADLAHTACGGLPQAGSSDAPIFFGEGILGPGNDQDTFSLGVPAGTAALRFTLNGEDGGVNDFDLLVKLGAPPTSGDFDCRGASSGVYESCELTDPTPGTWFVRIDRFRGAGEYQTTATVFAAPLSLIFTDGFESGNVAAWTSRVP